jgi:hypothetical protein
MAADNEVIRFAGDISIDKIEIISSNGFGQEVTNQIVAIEIYEDLFSPFISGVIALKDSLDLANLFPLVGEEYLNIKLHTPSFEGKNKVIDDQFYIFKMANREMSGDRNIIYELHFMTREAVVDLNKKVSKAYYGKCSDIAKSIITDTKDGLESKKTAIIEDTPNGVKFIANFWAPVKSLNYTAETSSNGNGNASYIFFENRNGLNFVSLESLYSGPIVQEFTYDSYMREFTPDGRSFRSVQEEYKRIIDISIPRAYDYIDRSRSGMFASKMINYDLVTKKYVAKNFDMLEDFPKEKHLNDFSPVSDKAIRRANSVVFAYPKYYGNFNNFGDVTNSKTIQKRMSLLQQAEATKIEIVVPGRTDYTVGQKIFMRLNKFNPIEGTDTQKEMLDNMFSGNYIVSAINHFIDREKHQCHMELIKDTLIVDLNKGGQ